MASWMISLRFIAYFEYDTSTEVSVTFERLLQFPAVTICNSNKYMKSMLNSSDEEFLTAAKELFDYEEYGNDYEYNYGSGSYDYYNYTAPDYSEFLSNLSTWYPQGFNIKQFTLEKGYQWDNTTVLMCQFKGSDCNLTRDFKHRFSSFGNCYTFNADLTKRRKFQDQPGIGNGLQLVIDIKLDDYVDPELTGGRAETGLFLEIHPQWEAPQVSSKGLAVGPGQHAYISVSRHETIDIKGPWGDCNPDLTLKYAENYTFSGCIVECKLATIVEQCGCKPLHYPGPADVCSPTKISLCVKPSLLEVKKHFSQLCSHCLVPCNTTEYSSSISYAPLHKNIVSSVPEWYKQFTNGSDYEHVKNNIVVLDIFFEEMNYHRTTKKPAIEASALISDIGGQLGLFLGFSALTFLEVFEYFVLKFHWCCTRKKKVAESSPTPVHSIQVTTDDKY